MITSPLINLNIIRFKNIRYNANILKGKNLKWNYGNQPLEVIG